MPADSMFHGFRFTPESIADLRATALEHAGEEVRPYFDDVDAHLRGWGPDDYREAEEATAAIERRLLEQMRGGAAADDPAVFAVLDDDLDLQRRIWTPTRDTYTALGRSFADWPALRAHLDARDPGLADFMRDAMGAYAAARLS